MVALPLLQARYTELEQVQVHVKGARSRSDSMVYSAAQQTIAAMGMTQSGTVRG
jgi:hypothetical protein